MFGKSFSHFKYGISLFGFSVGIFLFVSAYDAPTTHAGLSQEIVEYYQVVTNQSLSSENAEAMISGSILEDEPSSRVTRHFYDPVHNVGLLSVWQSSKEWLNGSKNEFAWDKGIEAYAKGDTKKAFEILGHALHLIEDASVPDHTRNDPHASMGLGGFYSNSPYENWTEENKDRETMRGIGKTLGAQEKIIPVFNSPEQALDTMATFSNNNFFSKDTISNDYILPKKDDVDGKYIYGTIKGKKYKLALYNRENESSPLQITLTSKQDTSVMSDYFSILGPEAIKNGAGMVALFIKQGEEAKAKLLAGDNPPTPEPPKDTFFGTLKKGMKIVPAYLRTLFQNSEDVARSLAAINQALPQNPDTQRIVQNTIKPILEPLRPATESEDFVPVNPGDDYYADITAPTQTEAEIRIEALQKANDALQKIQEQLVTYATQNNLPTTVSPTPTVTRSGGGGGGSSSRTTPPTPETETATTTDPVATTTPDTTVPTFTLTASDCLSATSTECTATLATPTVSWSTTDTDVDYWNTETSGLFGTTTATSSLVTLTAGATTTFALSAVDTSGNISATSTLSLFYPTPTVDEPPSDAVTLTEDTIFEQRSYHEFTTDLIVPEGITLTINQASLVAFAPGKSLFVYGTLIVNGGEDGFEQPEGAEDYEEPTVVFDRLGENGYWGGIYVAPSASVSWYYGDIFASEGIVFDGVTRENISLEGVGVYQGSGVGIGITNHSTFDIDYAEIQEIDGDAVSVSDSDVYLEDIYVDGANNNCLSSVRSTVSVEDGVYENCTIGISLADNSTLEIESLFFIQNNVIGISVTGGSTGSVHKGVIRNNSVFGLFLESGTFDATKNFWGDASGPFHPDNNSEGEGNAVSDGVLFDPWNERFGVFQG